MGGGTECVKGFVWAENCEQKFRIVDVSFCSFVEYFSLFSPFRKFSPFLKRRDSPEAVGTQDKGVGVTRMGQGCVGI